MDSNENENMIVSKNENGLYLNEIIIEKNVEIYRNVSFQIVNNSTEKNEVELNIKTTCEKLHV
jgi:hypothetical protein